MKGFRHFAADFYGSSKKEFLISLVYKVITEITNGINILLIIPLLSLVGIVEESKSIPLLSGISSRLRTGGHVGLVIVLGVYLALIFAQALIGKRLTLLNASLVQNYAKVLRDSIYENLINSPWQKISEKKVSDIITNLSVEVGRVSYGVICLQSTISQGLFALVQVSISFLVSPRLTLLVLGFGAVVFLLMYPTLRASKIFGKLIQENNKALSQRISDHLNHIKEIKSYGHEQREIDDYKDITDKLCENAIDFSKIQAKSTFIYKVLAGVILTLFVYISVALIKANPQELIITTIIFARLWPIFSSFQSNIQGILVTLPSFRALKDLEVELSKNSELKPQNITYSFSFENEIKLRDISFSYSRGKEGFNIEGLNLTFPKNKLTLILGKSGSGKSTLVDILLGLLEPTKGDILIDETPLSKDNLQAFRDMIAYVPQDPFLFRGTIRENLVKFNGECSLESIDKALSQAHAKEFIENLPNKLDTIIGDRGISLSGGEKQRLILAKALLRNPQILILDEATSALDISTEVIIGDALKSLKDNITIIIISHKLSSVKIADCIYFMKDSKIMEARDDLQSLWIED